MGQFIAQVFGFLLWAVSIGVQIFSTWWVAKHWGTAAAVVFFLFGGAALVGVIPVIGAIILGALGIATVETVTEKAKSNDDRKAS